MTDQGYINKKTFLLGVGCQKGGTSWIWDYLKSHPDCTMPAMKEMHIFDTFFMPKVFENFYKVRRKDLLRELSQTPELGIQEARIGEVTLYRLMAIYHDLNYYPVYLDSLIRNAQRRKGTQVRLIGDITPSYAGLNAVHFKHIKLLMEQAGYDVKVLFMMRDPVDRIWSATSMYARRAGESSMTSSYNQFLQEYADKQVHLRTDYAHTISALEKVFEKNKLYFGFYEKLFNISEIGRLTDFLGIKTIEPSFSKKVRANPQKSGVPTELATPARDHYAWVYDFCADKFGADFIRSIWKHY